MLTDRIANFDQLMVDSCPIPVAQTSDAMKLQVSGFVGNMM